MKETLLVFLSHHENVLKFHHDFGVESTSYEHWIKNFSMFFLHNFSSCSSACSPSLLVTVHLTKGNLTAIYPQLAEQFSVPVPFTQLEDEMECEAQQENGMDHNMELCLKLTETPMEEFSAEQEQSVCGERLPSDHVQSQQRCVGHCIYVQPDANKQTIVTENHCTNQHMEKEHESSRDTPSLINTHGSHSPAASAEDGKTTAGVVSSVSVAQLVMEEDSVPSDLEAGNSQQTPSPQQVHSNAEDPLSSQSVSSSPVRKFRRPAPCR